MPHLWKGSFSVTSDLLLALDEGVVIMSAKAVAPELAALNGPFTKIARAMSRNWGVRIIPSGTRCSTNGSTIRIPYTADYLAEEKRQVLHGMLDHEVSHVAEEREHREAGRETPLELLRRTSNRTVGMMFNVFEDVRIERKYSERFPGVAENLDVTNRDSVELHRKRTRAGHKPNFWRMFGCGIILKARDCDVGCLPAEVLPYLDLVTDEIKAIRRPGLWGEDSLAIAKRAYDKVKDKAAEAKKPPPPPEESEPEESEPEESEPEGEDSEPEESEPEGEDSEPEESEPEGEDSEPEESEDEDDDLEGFREAADDALNQEADADDLIDELKDDIEGAVKNDQATEERYIPNPAALALDECVVAEAPPEAAETYRNARDEIRDQIGALKAKQLALLQTLSRKTIRANQDRGDVDSGALASVRTGEKRVFTDVVSGHSLDTAVMVLIDLSGSMGDNDDDNNASYYALRTAIALAEAWDSLGIASMFMGFYNDWSRRPAFTSGVVNRHPFTYPVFKAFNERLARCRDRFVAIKGDGDNADGEAVLAAAKLLAQRPEKRKILMVISDGFPAHIEVALDVLNNHLRLVVKQVTSAGIEVFGIGAGTDAPAKFYNQETGASHLVIRDLRTMAKQVFKAMRDRVMKGVAV
jgi:cobalamin biosynthesis protein CobT